MAAAATARCCNVRANFALACRAAKCARKKEEGERKKRGWWWWWCRALRTFFETVHEAASVEHALRVGVVHGINTCPSTSIESILQRRVRLERVEVVSDWYTLTWSDRTLDGDQA